MHRTSDGDGQIDGQTDRKAGSKIKKIHKAIPTNVNEHLGLYR